MIPRSAVANKVPRTLKIESAMRPILAKIIHALLPHIYIKTQISRIQVSKCMSYADIYMNSDRENAIQELRTENWRIRKSLASQSQMRFVPKLRFYFDDKLEGTLLEGAAAENK